jgi:hypothetical protein
MDAMYASSSIIDINSDSFTVLRGIVTRSNGLSFTNHSTCKVEKSFNPGECEGSSTLQLTYNIGISSGGISRYSTKLAVDIRLYYYDKDANNNYINGQCQTIYVNPNVQSDTGVNSAEILQIKASDIRKIVVVFSFDNNTSDATADVEDFGLFKELSNKETVATIVAELGWGGTGGGWGGTGGFIFNNKIPQFPANGEGIENSTIWYDLTYENMGMPVSQMVALSQYNRLLGESIEADIGAGNGATLGGMFEDLLRTNGDFRGAVRDVIDEINAEIE